MEVNLWFARNQTNEIVSIINSSKEDIYICPICASKVIPKALESKKISPHFAHIDVSKCNGEAMIHWWYKNKFIQKGDKFKICTDKEIEFTCKDFKTEVTYQLESGTYRPDLVVETECGHEIVFEMANTNKKMVKDYIDRWIELDKIIVEVDIKSLQYVDEIKNFNALYYNGKCFNFNNRDGGYYDNIGRLKEEMASRNEYNIELVKKLDWFWDELIRFNNNEINIESIFEIMLEFRGTQKLNIIKDILKKKKCVNIFEDFLHYYKTDIMNKINFILDKFEDTSDFYIKMSENLYYGKLIDYSLRVEFEYQTIFTVGSILNKDINFNFLESEINRRLKDKKLKQIYRETNLLTGEYLRILEKELDLDRYYLCNYINPINYNLNVGIKYNGEIGHIITIPDNYIDFQDKDGYLYFYLRSEIMNYIDSIKEPDNQSEIASMIYNVYSKYEDYFLGFVNDKKVKAFINYKLTAKDLFIITLNDYHNDPYYLYIKNNKIYHADSYYFNKDIEKYCELYGDLSELESFIIKYYYNLHFSNVKCCNNNIIDYKEFEFCFKNNYRMPKLCKSCRKNRKKERLND